MVLHQKNVSSKLVPSERFVFKSDLSSEILATVTWSSAPSRDSGRIVFIHSLLSNVCVPHSNGCHTSCLGSPCPTIASADNYKFSIFLQPYQIRFWTSPGYPRSLWLQVSAFVFRTAQPPLHDFVKSVRVITSSFHRSFSFCWLATTLGVTQIDRCVSGTTLITSARIPHPVLHIVLRFHQTDLKRIRNWRLLKEKHFLSLRSNQSHSIQSQG